MLKILYYWIQIFKVHGISYNEILTFRWDYLLINRFHTNLLSNHIWWIVYRITKFSFALRLNLLSYWNIIEVINIINHVLDINNLEYTASDIDVSQRHRNTFISKMIPPTNLVSELNEGCCHSTKYRILGEWF